MSFTPPVFNSAIFRDQFPEFADATLYPDFTLAFAWNMGGNWINQNQPPVWGLSYGNILIPVTDSSGNPVVDSNGNPVVSTWTLTPLQQAADLMCAVILKQLFGPAASSGGAPAFRNTSGVGGPLTSASDEGTSSSYVLPSFGSSTFKSLLLSSAPYGPLLLSMLSVQASIGPYIPSGRFSYVPP